MNRRAILKKLIPVLLEDEWFLFVHKPAGLADVPIEPGTATSMIPVYEMAAMQSGVLAFAKTAEARRHLATGITTGSVKSAYVAVVQGRVKPGRSVVKGGIKKVGKDRFVADRAEAGLGAPSTHIQTLTRGDSRALVRCQIDGLDDRQVRAHLQGAHLHILGDADPRAGAGKKEPRPLMLHLEEVRFHHPGRKRAVSVRAPVPPAFEESLGLERGDKGVAGVPSQKLHVALTRRVPCFRDESTDAFRVLHSVADGVMGLAADVYDDVMVLQVLQGKFDAASPRLLAIAQWYHRMLGLSAVYLKHFAKDRSRQGADPAVSGPLFDPQPLVGQPAAAQIVVRENGLRFGVRPYDGYSTGLFLDQRENRRRVRELSSGKRVLNLFAYTCGFSVAAAAGGASQTVSVDASVKHLEWGKENFRANGLSPEDHVYIRDDVHNYFKRARRQGLMFDLIVLDPPSFARLKNPKRVFTVVKDLRPLLAEAMTVLTPGGVMLVCTNRRETTRGWLREQVLAAAGERGVSMMPSPGLPIDFEGDPDYAKSVLVRVG